MSHEDDEEISMVADERMTLNAELVGLASHLPNNFTKQSDHTQMKLKFKPQEDPRELDWKTVGDFHNRKSFCFFCFQTVAKLLICAL